MVKILETLDFTSGSARAALGRLVNRELLVRARVGRQVLYSLTPRADALLSEGDRRIFGFGRADPSVELWTVIWHAIPEDQRVSRSRFASRLRFLGFGALQDGTWVAARNHEAEVQQLVRQLDIAAHVSVIVGHMSSDTPPAAMVAQAWRLDEVAQRYDAFLAEFGPLMGGAHTRLSTAQAFRDRILMLHRFRGFPFIDPELPESIDTVRDRRKQVVACFEDVYAALEASASEYFWQVVERRQS